MHTEKREDPLVELGYEIRDVNKKALMNGTIGFFIFAIGSAAVGFVIFRLMYPTGFEAGNIAPHMLPPTPNPIVQSNITAKTDIMDLRQHEEAALDAPVGWVDASKTKLHIPIDRAMAIIAERGVPKTNAEVPAVTKGHTPDAAIGEKAPATGITLGTLKPGTAPTSINLSSQTASKSVTQAAVKSPVTKAPVGALPLKKKN